MSSVESPRGMAQGERKHLGPTDSSLTKRRRTDDLLGDTFSELSRRLPGQQPMPHYLTNSWEPVAMISREAVYNRPQPVLFEPTYESMRLAEPSREEITRHPNLIAPAVPHIFPSRPLIGSQISYESFRHPVGYSNLVCDSMHSSAYNLPPDSRRL